MAAEEVGPQATVLAPADDQEDSMRLAEKGKGVDVTGKESYVFFPDKLPSQRQLFYQLCDLKGERLQEVVHSNDGQELECDVRLVLDVGLTEVQYPNPSFLPPFLDSSGGKWLVRQIREHVRDPAKASL